MRKALVFLCVALFAVGMVAIVGCGEKKAEEKTEEVSEGTLPEIPNVEEDVEGPPPPTVLTDCPGYDFQNIERYPGSRRISFSPNTNPIMGPIEEKHAIITYETSASFKDVVSYYGNNYDKGWQRVESGNIDIEKEFVVPPGASLNALVTNGAKIAITAPHGGAPTHIYVDVIMAERPDLAELKSSDPTLELDNYNVVIASDSEEEDIPGEDPGDLRPPNCARVDYLQGGFVDYESSEPIGYFAAWYVHKGFELLDSERYVLGSAELELISNGAVVSAKEVEGVCHITVHP